MKLTILIPCYNEEKTIKKVIENIYKNISYEKEIIVIDDGSTDKTRAILKTELIHKITHLILNDNNYGKGYSLRQGIIRAKGDCVIIQDADLEYDPIDYDKLINPIKNGIADVVYGSRFTGASEKRVLFFWHTIGNKLLTLLSNIFTNYNLTDMEVGYKVFKTDLLKSIDLKENRFGFEPEITAKISKKKDVRLYEVGINYKGRKYEEGKKITWKDGFSAIRCIFYYNIFSKN